MQNGLVEIYTWICDTSVLASIRRSAECQQVGAVAAAMLLVLACWPSGPRARAAAAGADAGAFNAVHAGVAAAAAEKGRVVTISSTYHNRTVCARAVYTYAGTHASRQ